MPNLEKLILRSADLARKRAFYVDVLGMQECDNCCFRYSEQEVAICFEEASDGSYTPDAQDLYWKISIAVPDLDLAYRQLKDKGLSLKPPHQFRDVGYLTHIADPEGFIIELLQHGFEGDKPDAPVDDTLLGGGPCLNLITMRTSNIEAVQALCIEALGMRALSVQPVEDYGFTLYFYAFTGEKPPAPDLTAVANRSWTYRRPYTVLEVQHVHRGIEMRRPRDQDPGFSGVQVGGSSIAEDNVLGLRPISG